jgi:hypothetical protein
MGIPNVHNETGIHFGVINANEASLINSDWFDLFNPVYLDENGNVITDFDNVDDDLETEQYECDTDDFKASYNSNSNVIMIFYSKKTVRCLVCSPCYPNAGDLSSLHESGVETYTFNNF